MRKLLVAAVAAAILSVASSAQAATATMEAKIVRGNGDVAQVSIDPELAGKWTFVTDVSGQVNDVALQLYLEDSRGSCTGTLVGEHHLGDQNLKWNKRNVAPGQYTTTFDSTSTAAHCARVILWGTPGATASVTVTCPPAPSSGGLFDGLL